MKKSIIALILSAAFVFGSCDFGALPLSSSTSSDLTSTESTTTDSMDNSISDSQGAIPDDSTSEESGSQGGDVENDCNHEDEDNNEKCDDCGISVVITFDFFNKKSPENQGFCNMKFLCVLEQA